MNLVLLYHALDTLIMILDLNDDTCTLRVTNEFAFAEELYR